MNQPVSFSHNQSTRIPRRPSTSGGPVSAHVTTPRPSTSSGEVLETIQPENPFLRAALKGTPDRSRSTTPRRQRPTFRSQSYKDEWLPSSSDEKEKKVRTSAQRYPRQRRASEITISHNVSSASPQLGARATTNRLDKLEKENWDLKHRITLFQDSVQKLKRQLEEREEASENLATAKDHIRTLTLDLEAITKERDDAQQKTEAMINAIKDLEEQLEKSYADQEVLAKDVADRQGAIVEAAGIIQTYEGRMKLMEQQIQQHEQMQQTTRLDSDYYSAEAELAHARALPAVNKALLGDSDYFSADTSPASDSRSVGQRLVAEASPSLRAAKNSSAAFNQEVGIRESASKESLLQRCLQSSQATETASQAASLSSRILRLRSIRKRTQSPTSAAREGPESSRKTQLEIKVDSTPLRNLYASGEPQLTVHSGTSSGPSNLPLSPAVKSAGLITPGVAVVQLEVTTPAASVTATPRQTSTSANKYSKLLHFRSNSTTTKPGLSLHRQNTSPVPPVAKPQLSPLPPTSQRRYSIDATRPRSLASSSTSHKRLSQSPAAVEHHEPSPAQLQNNDTIGEINSPVINNRSSIPLLSPTYATPPAQTAPTYSVVKPTTKTHRSPPTPNFSHWPRRYPAWPPSAGLVNRDLLFHGDGQGDTSPTTSGSEPSP